MNVRKVSVTSLRRLEVALADQFWGCFVFYRKTFAILELLCNWKPTNSGHAYHRPWRLQQDISVIKLWIKSGLKWQQHLLQQVATAKQPVVTNHKNICQVSLPILFQHKPRVTDFKSAAWDIKLTITPCWHNSNLIRMIVRLFRNTYIVSAMNSAYHRQTGNIGKMIGGWCQVPDPDRLRCLCPRHWSWGGWRRGQGRVWSSSCPRVETLPSPSLPACTCCSPHLSALKIFLSLYQMTNMSGLSLTQGWGG